MKMKLERLGKKYLKLSIRQGSEWMLGKYKIDIKSKKLTYEFNIERKVTIIRDFSATGKSTLCKLIDK